MAAVDLPALHGDVISFCHLSGGETDNRYASAPANSADLPIGFRSLWLQTGCISLGSAGHSGGAAVTGVDVAEELCRFLGLAPQCYKEFRVSADAWHMWGISIYAEWLPLPDEAMACSSGSFDGLLAMAAAMQQFVSAHGLAVSVPGNLSYLLVVRL